MQGQGREHVDEVESRMKRNPTSPGLTFHSASNSHPLPFWSFRHTLIFWSAEPVATVLEEEEIDKGWMVGQS